MPVVPTTGEVTIASFVKVLGTGSCGTVWLVSDDVSDTVPAKEEQRQQELQRPNGPLPTAPVHSKFSVLRRDRSGGSAPMMRRGPQHADRKSSLAGDGAASTAADDDLPSTPVLQHHSPPAVVPPAVASFSDLQELQRCNGSSTSSSPPPPPRRAIKVSPNPRNAAASADGGPLAISSEQDFLAQLHHPFIVRFHGASSDEHKTYLCVEASVGGDLHTLLRVERLRLCESQARLVAGCLASALGFLHARLVIYRDLKPENVLLDDDGLVQLIDFGLTKRLASLDERSYTICGTPEYVAPEVVQRLGHGTEVDWWALGVLTYELVHGYTPFSGEGTVDDPLELYRRITHPMVKVDYSKCPTELSPPMISYIKRTLFRNPRKRLGAAGDLAEVRAHDFFARLDFEALEARHPAAWEAAAVERVAAKPEAVAASTMAHARQPTALASHSAGASPPTEADWPPPVTYGVPGGSSQPGAASSARRGMLRKGSLTEAAHLPPASPLHGVSSAVVQTTPHASPTVRPWPHTFTITTGGKHAPTKGGGTEEAHENSTWEFSMY